MLYSQEKDRYWIWAEENYKRCRIYKKKYNVDIIKEVNEKNKKIKEVNDVSSHNRRWKSGHTTK